MVAYEPSRSKSAAYGNTIHFAPAVTTCLGIAAPFDADFEAASAVSGGAHLQMRVPALTQWPPSLASGETPSGQRSIRRRRHADVLGRPQHARF
ncbi:hypothetical protein HPB50_016241 [Hyalomma asiaticum]|uniref:Uncharacterized protein n=1 Tax=Hyalomma asiaticum TaxID=266040 RepID=A0ACB7THC3_HYAAI|nr:hypothetical protein HPB50_016241 [Hyalomma asiaticum]